MLALALEGIHITLDGAPLLSVDTVIAPDEVLTVMVTHDAAAAEAAASSNRDNSAGFYR